MSNILKFILSLALILILCSSNAILAAGTNRVKTNKNEVTKEFDEITNKNELEKDIEGYRNGAELNIGGGDMAEVFKPSEGAVSDLKGIDDFSLEEKGRDAKDAESNKYFSEFNYETDYTKAGAMGHKIDADEIVSLTEKKLQELTEVLRRNGIDCEPKDDKTKEIEDPYYIEIERSTHKEVEYYPHFCEYPRFTYNCNDSLTIRCEKPNWRYYEWKETRWIDISGWDARSYGWLFSIKWKSKRFGLHMKTDGSIDHSVRHNIAHRIGKKHEQIGELFITQRGEGNIPHAGGKEYVFERYKIGYRYREAEEICDKWSEPRWDERCSVNP